MDCDKIKKAEQCLVDNGVDSEEVNVVLEALGYILLDEELYKGKEMECEENKMNEWTSVKDSLPEEGQYCVILMTGKVYDNPVMAVDRMEEKNFFSYGSDTRYEITHWLPIPEPPEKDVLEGD